ncbi:endopeptidase La [Psittacicella melopsittaci]|uniref:endopeptidase La n=1 Tax=Psittacicella melopsittaci TaxID=2028576 RepID=A0A3A1Y712_9GAMM|nr:endopeptidase La [Psittacicella melopsittaci]RIY33059.1 endopeptidase La [Psittacicella melopsittaci]
MVQTIKNNYSANSPVIFIPGVNLFENLYSHPQQAVSFSLESSNELAENFFKAWQTDHNLEVLFVVGDKSDIPTKFGQIQASINSLPFILTNVAFLAKVVKITPEFDENDKTTVVAHTFEVQLIAETTINYKSISYSSFVAETATGAFEFTLVSANYEYTDYFKAYLENQGKDQAEVEEDLTGQPVRPKAREQAVEKLKQAAFALVRAGLTDSTSAALEFSENSDPEVQYQTTVYSVLQRLGFTGRIINAFVAEKTLYARYVFLIAHLEFLLKRDSFDAELQEAVRKNMETSQRKYYLNEQIRTLRKELNADGGDSEESDVDRFLAQLELLDIADLLPEIHKKITTEINRLLSIPSSSQEYYMQQNYVEWLLKVPYRGSKLNKIDLTKAREVLDRDHFGLDDVKERVLEYLAVLSRVDVAKSPVLCLIGPPGVGKTSLGKSIAEATGRKYTRWALGGISDEAEIRGHRRTYIGSQPGKVINHLSKVEVNNPLFLLDEIDKLSQSYRGDPAAALLEVLDPEQNNKFVDNYLEIDYDLSKVLFIATANSYNIPQALLDRMEVVDLGSYTRDEKFQIAKQHILRKLLKRNAIKEGEISFPDSVINFIIDGYTNEPGVRSLERRMERIIRYVIKQIVESKISKVDVDESLVQKVLGPVVNESNMEQTEFRAKSFVGQITGLAWTQAGGDVLPIEAATPNGKGEISATGSLGDQIKESIRAAITVIRQRAEQFGIDPDFYSKKDFHVHFPNAGISKDGPSAGSAITTCLISSLTGKPIAMDIGMTGEISLHGDVLRIGGVKEKVISAHRNGVKHIVLPKSNEPDLYKVPQSIKDELQFYPVETIDEVVEIVFGDKKRPAKPTKAEQDLERAIAAEKKAPASKETKPKAKKTKTKAVANEPAPEAKPTKAEQDLEKATVAEKDAPASEEAKPKAKKAKTKAVANEVAPEAKPKKATPKKAKATEQTSAPEVKAPKKKAKASEVKEESVVASEEQPKVKKSRKKVAVSEEQVAPVEVKSKKVAKAKEESAPTTKEQPKKRSRKTKAEVTETSENTETPSSKTSKTKKSTKKDKS